MICFKAESVNVFEDVFAEDGKSLSAYFILSERKRQASRQMGKAQVVFSTSFVVKFLFPLSVLRG